MNPLALAVIHDAKNSLAEVILRLEARGDCQLEITSMLRAANSLTNLLLWHRQQAGDMRISINSASPTDLLNELVAEARPYFAHLQIDCDTSLAPVYWFYDAAYLQLALANALHNACRFAKTKVSITVAQVEKQLVFTVRDDGDGYSDAMLAQQPQLAAVTQHGTGLGLALASAIAHMHSNQGVHGSVRLYNAGGAVFELTLP